MSQNFGATNAPDTCLWCGRKLRRQWDSVLGMLGRGYLGLGLFCTLSCGYRFAWTAADQGTRLKPKGE